jgi:hypothetical protein
MQRVDEVTFPVNKAHDFTIVLDKPELEYSFVDLSGGAIFLIERPLGRF